MAAVRRGQGSMKVDLPKTSLPTPDLPPISALFLIYFDVKAGYTISWKRSLPGVELDGAVEYKSLPSGLHTVKDDLVYFVHDGYAGLSAFANAPVSEESRNARMIAVGLLVPLSYGRLGRSWKHANKLIDMAQKLVIAPSETKVLEVFWESHKADEDKKSEYADTFVESPSSTRFQPIIQQPTWTKGHGRTRSASDGTVLQSAYNVSPYHPVWSLSRLLDLFGPLIFPIYRAALLRRRILICGHVPVRETCDFVYDISVISNIPFAVNDLLAPSAPPQRLRPLFSIGVHDIPFLEDDYKASNGDGSHDPDTSKDQYIDEPDSGCGWIACTTDDILAMKDNLYDVLIALPPSYSAEAKNKIWPKVESPRGTQIKATQRDLRRYGALKWGLSRTLSESSGPAISANTAENDNCPSSAASHKTVLLDTIDTDSIIEPLSWSALAYSGFIWWASAGEQRRLETSTDDSENDSILLDGFSLTDPIMQASHPSQSTAKSSSSQAPPTSATATGISLASTSVPASSQGQSAKREMAIIAYFHRLTTLMLTTLSDIIDTTSPSNISDDEDTPLQDNTEIDPDTDTDPIIYITTSDITKMGLNEWSTSDAAFVIELCQVYFGRTAEVEGTNIDICGIRIC